MHLYVQQSCAEIMSKRCTSKLCAGQEVERIATCCSALQFVAVRCSVLQCVAGYEYWAYTDAPARPARRVAVLCSVLQCVLQGKDFGRMLTLQLGLQDHHTHTML